MKSLLVGIFSLMVLPLACGGNNSSYEGAPSMDIATPIGNFEEEAPTQSPEQVTERKLIKTGNISFETDDLEETRQKVLAAVQKHQGYVSSDNENSYDNRVNATIVVRVPSQRFDAFLAEATEGVQKFDNRQIFVNDVTEEFLDVEARLKTKKELEQRYQELLGKANTVNEILQIEKQIGVLRSEIESIEGRLKYLRSQVAMSTLTMNFYREKPKKAAYGKQFSNGFSSGWKNFMQFLILLTHLWPFILIFVLVLFGLRWFIKKSTKK